MSAPQNPQQPYHPPQPQQGYPQQGYPQQGYPQQQGYPPQPPPPRKGMPIWAWLLIGMFTLAVLVVIGASVAAYMFVKKAEQVARNPLAAIVQIAAAANPDIDVVDVNESTGKVTVRDKKTGKTVTIDGDAIRDGKISIDTEDGHAVLGSGANVKMPDWVFIPAGSKVVGGMTANGKDGVGGTVLFTSTEPLDALKSLLEEKYKSAGYEQSVSAMSTTHGEQAMQLAFTHDARKRSVTIGAAKSSEGSGGTITFAEGQ
jgi:hypothetical protein